MSSANPVCDFCNGDPGQNGTALSAAHVMAGFRSGARPRPIMDVLTTMSATFGLEVGREQLFQNWLENYRNDTSDWLLCRDCRQVWESELERPTGARPAAGPAGSPTGSPTGPPRRGWLDRLFGRFR